MIKQKMLQGRDQQNTKISIPTIVKQLTPSINQIVTYKPDLNSQAYKNNQRANQRAILQIQRKFQKQSKKDYQFPRNNPNLDCNQAQISEHTFTNISSMQMEGVQFYPLGKQNPDTLKLAQVPIHIKRNSIMGLAQVKKINIKLKKQADSEMSQNQKILNSQESSNLNVNINEIYDQNVTVSVVNQSDPFSCCGGKNKNIQKIQVKGESIQEGMMQSVTKQVKKSRNTKIVAIEQSIKEYRDSIREISSYGNQQQKLKNKEQKRNNYPQPSLRQDTIKNSKSKKKIQLSLDFIPKMQQSKKLLFHYKKTKIINLSKINLLTPTGQGKNGLNQRQRTQHKIDSHQATNLGCIKKKKRLQVISMQKERQRSKSLNKISMVSTKEKLKKCKQYSTQKKNSNLWMLQFNETVKTPKSFDREINPVSYVTQFNNKENSKVKQRDHPEHYINHRNLKENSNQFFHRQITLRKTKQQTKNSPTKPYVSIQPFKNYDEAKIRSFYFINQ